IDKELVFKDRVRKFDFSLIKAGKDYNEKLFNGQIDILSFDHKAYKTTYGIQNLTVLALSIIALFILFALKKKIILFFKYFFKDFYLQTKYALNILFQNIKLLPSWQFYICAAVVFLYALPIILADVPFSDDYGRIIGGWAWNHDSRFLTEIIYKIISFNLNMVNVAPLSLIVGMSFLLISSYMLFWKWAGKHSAAVSLSTLSLILSPIILFTLISYQIDAVGIAFSFVFALGIFLIPDSSNVKFKFFSAFILTFCVMLTHQSSIAVVAILMFTEFIIVINKQNDDYKKALNLFLIRAASSVSSLFVWYITVGRFSRYDTILNESAFIFAIIERTKTFAQHFVLSYFYGRTVLFIFCILFACFVFICFKIVLKLLREKLILNKISAILVAFIPFALLFLGIIGANITTNFKLYIGNTMFLSFSPFIACMAFITIDYYRGYMKKIIVLLSIAPLLYSFSLSYAYAKYLTYSYETNQIIVSSLLSNIQTDKQIVILSKTTNKDTQRTRQILKAFPIINRLKGLLNLEQTQNPFHLEVKLNFFGLNCAAYDSSKQDHISLLNDAKNNYDKIQLISRHYYYNLWQYKNLYIIDFAKDEKLSL
ncbi:MAG: glucosyltransferase domain-containing protein, partial [Endomicrobium sp.]|nr:glucosyltransferase domain-containing protein [Endomicrobium sp.]